MGPAPRLAENVPGMQARLDLRNGRRSVEDTKSELKIAGPAKNLEFGCVEMFSGTKAYRNQELRQV